MQHCYALFLCFEYCTNTLNKILLKIKFSFRVKLRVPEYFSILKVEKRRRRQRMCPQAILVGVFSQLRLPLLKCLQLVSSGQKLSRGGLQYSFLQWLIVQVITPYHDYSSRITQMKGKMKVYKRPLEQVTWRCLIRVIPKPKEAVHIWAPKFHRTFKVFSRFSLCLTLPLKWHLTRTFLILPFLGGYNYRWR